MTKTARARLTLLLVAAAFAAPLVLSLLLQSPAAHWDPTRTRNLGELIKPVVALQSLPIPTRQTASQADVEATWTLLYIAPPDCGKPCDQRLQLLEKVRESQGREMPRVRLEVVEAAQSPLTGSALWTVRSADTNQQQQLVQSLGLSEGGLVLLDPFRNAMLRYPADFDGTMVRKDLNRMLKISQAGKSRSTGLVG